MRASDGADPVVRARGLSKRFGTTRAVDEVDLRVEPGVRLALTGPNGAGKTTLLKLLAGLLAPSGGELEVFGRAPASPEPGLRSRLGFLGPSDYLYDPLTARENLRFACRMSGLPAHRDRLDATLDRVGLGGHGDDRVGGFSSGMRRRLALARVLLRPPDLALLDEPYTSLDRAGGELLEALLDGMRERGATVILASHGRRRAVREADRVIRLEGGRLVAPRVDAGRADEAGRRP